MDTKRQHEDWLEHRPGPSDLEGARPRWSDLWGIMVPSKVKIFAWRLAHVSLPTGDVRASRNMAQDDVCSMCNSTADSWRHSLIECNMAKAVWALMDDDIVNFVHAGHQEDLKLWLFNLIEVATNEEVVRVLVTLWSIWWGRRKAIHEQQFQSPLSTFSFVRRFLADLQLLPVKKAIQPGSPRRLARSGWQAPAIGCAKIYVDGGVHRGEQKGAVSAVRRDANGVYLGASSVVFEGLTHPATLEAIACSEAMSLASDLNLTRVQIATDCLQVVRNVKEANPCSYGVIIKEILTKKAMFQRFPLAMNIELAM